VAWVLTALLCIGIVELALRLPFAGTLSRLAGTGARAARVVRSPAISDCWKEKAVGAYARRTFLATVRLAGLLAAVLGTAAVLAYGFDRILSGYGAFLLGWTGFAFSAVFAGTYAWVRAEMRRPSAYGFADRFLHRLALGVRPVAEMSLDIDRKASGAEPAETDAGHHVFVAGLARAGTTALMRRLHASGAFRSLTYRDMPFVLAPNTLGRTFAASSRVDEPTERAHGDGILVSADSPEALDEVYWRTVDREGYLFADRLAPHSPDRETLAGYVAYVRAVLASGGQRYLSKNNNNVLRLPALRRAFPKAAILVPFREPLAHAASLQRQHRRFVAMQGRDPFVRDYMTWLGHHEFGRDHRPFVFDAEGGARIAARDPDGIDHWLELWVQTYTWLERTAPPGTVFVPYERLCRDPAVWRYVAALAGIDPSAGAPFVEAAVAPDVNADRDLAAKAAALHHRLLERWPAAPDKAVSAA